MTLSEFEAMEAAYRVLLPLDAAARRRAVRWLSDALGSPDADPLGPGDSAGSDAAPAAASATPAPAKRAKRSASRGTTARTRAARRAKATSKASEEERAYRRMPPASEVMAAYRQVGTITGLAEYYDVPRHTAQGWAARLRRDGHPIGRPA